MNICTVATKMHLAGGGNASNQLHVAVLTKLRPTAKTWIDALRASIEANHKQGGSETAALKALSVANAIRAARNHAAHKASSTWTALEVDEPIADGMRDALQQTGLGSVLDGWPDEKWLDIRSTAVRDLMKARLDLAKSKGCDGVEPDNVDGFDNNNGLRLTQQHQVNYNQFLATEGHARGLSVGLKNSLGLVSSLVSSFDWALNGGMPEVQRVRQPRAVHLRRQGGVSLRICDEHQWHLRQGPARFLHDRQEPEPRRLSRGVQLNPVCALRAGALSRMVGHHDLADDRPFVVPREKLSYFLSFADANDLTPLRGGRGAYIFEDSMMHVIVTHDSATIVVDRRDSQLGRLAQQLLDQVPLNRILAVSKKAA